MPDLTWTIDTTRTDGGITANGDIEAGGIPSAPNRTRGERVDLNLGFWEDPDLSDHLTRYQNLLDYADFAGSATVDRAVNGTPVVTERVPASAPVGSIIVDVAPGADVDYAQGFWGVIQQVDDQTTVPADMAVVEVRLTYLADASEYAGRQALKDDLGEALP